MGVTDRRSNRDIDIELDVRLISGAEARDARDRDVLEADIGDLEVLRAREFLEGLA